MSARKFNLSPSLQGAISGATPPVESDKVLIERIKASGSVDTARMEVIQEAFKVLSSIAAVFEAREKHKHAKVEWAGRVDVAKAAVEQAINEAKQENDRLTRSLKTLDQTAMVAQPLIQLFNFLMEKLKSADIPEEQRKEALDKLMELAPQLASLKG